jgi:hypothetical protein
MLESRLLAGAVLWSGNACIYHQPGVGFVVEWPTAPEALAWVDRTYYATFTELRRSVPSLLARVA